MPFCPKCGSELHYSYGEEYRIPKINDDGLWDMVLYDYDEIIEFCNNCGYAEIIYKGEQPKE